MVTWLVGNAVFPETARRIFLIFCMKLGDCKTRKVTEPDFWKISPKSDTLIFFSKTVLTIFFYLTKYDLQFEWHLFSRKICNLEIFDLEIVKKISHNKVFGHFLDFGLLVFLDFPHNDWWAWCLDVFLQFAGPVNVFLFALLDT